MFAYSFFIFIIGVIQARFPKACKVRSSRIPLKSVLGMSRSQIWRVDQWSSGVRDKAGDVEWVGVTTGGQLQGPQW